MFGDRADGADDHEKAYHVARQAVLVAPHDVARAFQHLDCFRVHGIRRLELPEVAPGTAELLWHFLQSRGSGEHGLRWSPTITYVALEDTASNGQGDGYGKRECEGNVFHSERIVELRSSVVGFRT